LQRARQLAAAANAAMDAVCIDVFLEAIQAFHDVRDAESLLAAAARSEEIALRTYEVTTARLEGGTGVLTDQLHARTAHVRARLRRIEAEASLEGYRGRLAMLAGLETSVRYTLEPGDAPRDYEHIQKSVDALIDEALANHPRAHAARSRLNASRAAVN